MWLQLFSSRRRVRLFIMDAEDEEDEDEDEDGDETTERDGITSHLEDTNQPLTDDDDDKENSRESGGMDM